MPCLFVGLPRSFALPFLGLPLPFRYLFSLIFRGCAQDFDDVMACATEDILSAVLTQNRSKTNGLQVSLSASRAERADEKSFPRGAPVQHLAPRGSPEGSKTV